MRRALVSNPPWVAALLATYYDTIRRSLVGRPEWLPQLQDMQNVGGDWVVAAFREYGCGVYGCVIPTLDPKIVLKVTTDDTEAEFAVEYANDLVAPVCVRYPAALALPEQHKDLDVFLLWRDSAEHVGDIVTQLGMTARDLVNEQWNAAQVARKLLYQQSASPHARQQAVEAWLVECEAMAEVPELEALALGMVKVYREQHIFFGDLHSGNLGVVKGETGAPEWRITDPGNIIVIQQF